MFVVYATCPIIFAMIFILFWILNEQNNPKLWYDYDHNWKPTWEADTMFLPAIGKIQYTNKKALIPVVKQEWPTIYMARMRSIKPRTGILFRAWKENQKFKYNTYA